MKDHYNLYYIFLEDMQRHPMSEKRNAEIRKNLDNFYRKIKPPWEDKPPNIIGDESPEKSMII